MMCNEKVAHPPRLHGLQIACGQLWNGFHTQLGLVCQRETPPIH